MAWQKFQIDSLPYCWDQGQVEQAIEEGVVLPLVQCYLGVVVEAVDTADRMDGYEENGFLDRDFSILETKELVGFDVVPMKSKGLDIVLQVVKVGATVCQDMSMVEEIDYQHYSKN